MLNVHTSRKPLDESTAALNKLLKETKGKDVLLLLSGGSSLEIANGIDGRSITSSLTVSALDERFTFDEESSNFAALKQTKIWPQLWAVNASTIDPRPKESDTLELAANRYDTLIKKWHEEHVAGIVIVTMGIGADGHIAGVLPFPEDPVLFHALFEDTLKHITGYNASPEKNPHPERITTTLRYLRTHVHHVIAYVAGVEKRSAIDALVTEGKTLAQAPVRVLHELRDVHLYTDLTVHK